MESNLKWFMRKYEPEIVEVPAPARFTDDEGNVQMLKVKKLPQEEINKINDMYTTKRIATDKKGNALISGQEVVWKVEKDSGRASRHIAATAIVDPDLTSEECMNYYGCVDKSEILLKVFPTFEEYTQVMDSVFKVLGIRTGVEDEGESDKDERDSAKN